MVGRGGGERGIEPANPVFEPTADRSEIDPHSFAGARNFIACKVVNPRSSARRKRLPDTVIIRTKRSRMLREL